MSNRIGIHLPPEQWTDNGPNITILYNEPQAQFAFIEVRIYVLALVCFSVLTVNPYIGLLRNRPSNRFRPRPQHPMETQRDLGSPSRC